jgi:hypothetical protein
MAALMIEPCHHYCSEFSALSLANKRSNRFSKCAMTSTSSVAHCVVRKFTKKLLGEAMVEGLETVLGGRLVGRDSDGCCTHVVHGLMDDIKTAMDGS